MPGRVVVVGSINVDLVVSADRLPTPGETVLGGVFEQHFGGKGANQAVAAARAGADVRLIGAVGDDAFGDASLAALISEGVDVRGVRRVAAPTGVAIIAVGRTGENQIVVAAGANSLVAVPDQAWLAEEEVLVTGFEVPVATAIAAVRGAVAAGGRAIVNPAPAIPLPDELLALGPILVANERELAVAAGITNRTAALDALVRRNRSAVVVTLGREGAILAEGERRSAVPARRVRRVVDTTGAGDAFVGVLAVWVARGSSRDDAVAVANVAGSLAVTRRGAREGMPSEHELRAALAAS